MIIGDEGNCFYPRGEDQFWAGSLVFKDQRDCLNADYADIGFVRKKNRLQKRLDPGSGSGMTLRVKLGSFVKKLCRREHREIRGLTTECTEEHGISA